MGARHVVPVAGGLLIIATGSASARVHRVMRDRGPYEIREGGFAGLFQQFRQEYGDAYLRLAAELKERYPDITRRERRTGRALRNICFFVWSYARDGDERFIPTLFAASVLLSAQDDYYDNRRISRARKSAFCSAVNLFIKTSSFPPGSGSSPQTRELEALWSEVARPIRTAARPVHSYWKEKACQLNEAMEAENRVVRSRAPALDQYLDTAVHSIGMVFIWSTYLVHKNVPLSTIDTVDATLLRGARVVRLSNDIASYRQGEGGNAVILLGGGKRAENRVMQLIAHESRMFRAQLDALPVESDVKRVLLRSTEFLREFYQRSDFDKRTLR